MNAHVEAVMEMAKQLPVEERVELLDALFSLVSPTDSELEAGWIRECEDRCAAIDRGEMPLIAADVVIARYA